MRWDRQQDDRYGTTTTINDWRDSSWVNLHVNEHYYFTASQIHYLIELPFLRLLPGTRLNILHSNHTFSLPLPSSPNIALGHSEYFKLKEFENRRYKDSDFPSTFSLEASVRLSRGRHPPYTQQKAASSFLKTRHAGEAKWAGLAEFSPIYYSYPHSLSSYRFSFFLSWELKRGK